MIEESGTVVADGRGLVWVETQPRSSCASCAVTSCTSSVISGLFGTRSNCLQLENTLGAVIGDRVVVGIPDELLVRASLLAYLLPAIGMLAGALLADIAGLVPALQGLSALCGLVAGLVLLRRNSRKPSQQQRYRPQLLRMAGFSTQQVALPLSGGARNYQTG